MPTNRFYTQALPQYTSQFVEDQTPWDQLIGLEQQKISRSDAAIAGASKAQGAFSSLVGGYRTGEIVPQVIDKYTNELKQWQEEYGDQLYSVPAMQKLTSIQGRFQADPNVKLSLQDRELNEYYDRLRANPNYDARTDPNLEDGQIRQLKPGDQFSSYQQPIYRADANPMIDEFLEGIATREIEGDAYEVPVLDPETGKPTGRTMMEKKRYEVRNKTDFDKSRGDFTKSVFEANGPEIQYLKALHGPDFGVEEFKDLVRSRESGKGVYKEVGSSSFFPQGRAEDTKVDLSGYGGQGPVETVMNRRNSFGGDDVDPGIGKATAAKIFSNDALLHIGSNTEYYNIVKDNPEFLLSGKPVYADQDKKSGNAITPGLVGLEALDPRDRPDMTSRLMIEQRTLDDPSGTETMFEKYYGDQFVALGIDYNGEQGKEMDELTADLPLEKKRAVRDLAKEYNYTMGWVHNMQEKIGINKDAYDNDIDLNQAMWAYHATKNDPDSPFEGELDFNNLSPRDVMKLKANTDSWVKKQSRLGLRPDIIKFGKEEALAWTQYGLGPTGNDDGRLMADNGIPATFRGGRLVVKNRKGEWEEQNPRQRESFFKKDAAAFIEGMLTPESSQYGPGMLIGNIGGEEFQLEAPPQIVDPMRFAHNAYSYEMPNAAGKGDFFRIRGFNQDGSFNVFDQWTNMDGKASSHPDDIWMGVIDNIKTGEVEVISYYGNPEKSIKAWRQPISEDNPQGYITVGIPENPEAPNSSPDLIQMENAAMEAYRLGLTRK